MIYRFDRPSSWPPAGGDGQLRDAQWVVSAGREAADRSGAPGLRRVTLLLFSPSASPSCPGKKPADLLGGLAEVTGHLLPANIASPADGAATAFSAR